MTRTAGGPGISDREQRRCNRDYRNETVNRARIGHQPLHVVDDDVPAIEDSTRPAQPIELAVRRGMEDQSRTSGDVAVTRKNPANVFSLTNRRSTST